VNRACNISIKDKFLQTIPFTFDPSVFEIWCPLVMGATLVLPQNGMEKDLEYEAAVIEKHNITFASFVASKLKAFLEQNFAPKCQSLRNVISGGEALTPQIVNLFQYHYKYAVLHNQYGPTETTIVCSSYIPTGKEEKIPIGNSLSVDNMELFLLDNQGKLITKATEQGEICISGIGLARGYFNLKEKTDAVFTKNPTDNSRLMYRTGDLGYYLEDKGDGINPLIIFTGRSDFQVKIRGHRIELGSVEAALSEHSAVKECVVIAPQNDTGTRYMIAYIGTKEKITPLALKQFLTTKLPDYSIPSHIEILRELPRGSTGKVDRTQLPPPSIKIEDISAIIEPKNDLQRKLVKMWEDEMKVSLISVTDDFFSIGGESLLAYRLIPKMQILLHNTEVSLSVFYLNSTV